MGVKIEGKQSITTSIESSVLAHQAGKIAEKVAGGNGSAALADEGPIDVGHTGSVIYG